MLWDSLCTYPSTPSCAHTMVGHRGPNGTAGEPAGSRRRELNRATAQYLNRRRVLVSEYLQANGSASVSHSVHKAGMFQRVKNEVEDDDDDTPADEKEEEAHSACERCVTARLERLAAHATL